MTDFEYIEFDVENAKGALKGDPIDLRRMCIWRRTPQGYDFWRKEYNRMGSGDPLIEGWIRECEGNDHNDQVDDHAGMIYNEYNKTWSFGII